MPNIATLEKETAQAVTSAKAMLARFHAAADSEGRVMSAAEKSAIEQAMEEARGLKGRLDRANSDVAMTAQIERLTGGMTAGDTRRPASNGGLGSQFINSATFEWLKRNRGSLPTGAWTSPSSELMASTLTSDSASGGALIIPDHRPGIVELPTRPLVMADLIAPGTTDSNLVGYMREVLWTNTAATVAEGAAKPESTLAFEAASDPVRKIATWIPVVEEMLEDVPALGSYLDGRLRLGVQLAEDAQLLNGSVIAPDIVGFLNRVGLAPAIARGTDTSADAILRQIAAIFTATGLQPTGIVMNPSNWITIQLTKAADGTYISGGTPFSTPPTPTLWGLPVALTNAIAVNTALVGAFKTGAQLFRKGGLRVEASNSHAAFFIENKIAIRAGARRAGGLSAGGVRGRVGLELGKGGNPFDLVGAPAVCAVHEPARSPIDAPRRPGG